MLALFFTLFLVALANASTVKSLRASSATTTNNTTELYEYKRVHSYPTSYTFDERDGWESVPVSDLTYKYNASDASPSSNSVPPAHRSNASHRASTSRKRWSKTKGETKDGGLLGDLAPGLPSLMDSMEPQGSSENVVITWYTGNDLLNPSCWASSGWHPTDESFACALTLEGWTNRPKCFKFLELCNGPHKCVYVRVVDTCAGCAPGSKHVDLTKAAFTSLAPLSEGLLNVQMRMANDPDHWSVPLWGPQA